MPAWVSINSTMSARPNPQIWLLGTPPTPEDNGEVFTSIRSAALGGKSRTLAYLEWSAHPDDDPALAETRAKANPAWSTRINHEVVQGEYETYPPDRFALDRLGIWRSDSAALVMPNWPACATTTAPPAPAALGIAADLDQTWLSLGAASTGVRPHLGSVRRVRADARAAFVADVKRIQDETNCAVGLDRKGPASFLIPALEDAGVRLTLIALDDFVQASADIVAAVEAGDVEHGDYDDLNDAVRAAGWRLVADRRVFARKNGDISSLEAVTVALWVARQNANYDLMQSFG
jgi:hypothetical protein